MERVCHCQTDKSGFIEYVRRSDIMSSFGEFFVSDSDMSGFVERIRQCDYSGFVDQFVRLICHLCQSRLCGAYLSV